MLAGHPQASFYEAVLVEPATRIGEATRPSRSLSQASVHSGRVHSTFFFAAVKIAAEAAGDEAVTTSDAISRGRESFERQAWGDAYAQLLSADRDASLSDLDDLERLATAAYLIGNDAEAASVLTRAYNACVSSGEIERAARCGFHIVMMLADQGDIGQASGWLGRAQRLLDDGQRDCAERGYLMLPVALQCVAEGDIATALATFTEAAGIGDRFHDIDLITLGRMGRGRCLIGLGQISAGMTLLDEVMVAVTSGEVSPIVAGIVYCSVIEACHDVFDMRRAQEWTEALSRWCISQPDLVAYRGECLVRRAEIMRLHGAWQDAMEEAERACEVLSRPSSQSVAGAAFYQRGEAHRLRGDFAKAEQAYREASRRGRAPEPGLALLRLAQGRVDASRAGIQRAIDEAPDPATRSTLLAACVEIMLAANDPAAARVAADELSEIAGNLDAAFLNAISAQAGGAVLLAEGEARSALAPLRRAWTAWQELEAPYEAARVRVLIGAACRQLGDDDTAEMELDAARLVLRQLGAVSELQRVEALSNQQAGAGAAGLTPRELEVLRLVASGKTNRAIAGELFISEKTVARHVSNIFVKLQLSSRSAATAYAHEHGLVR